MLTAVTTAGWVQEESLALVQADACRTARNCATLCSGAERTTAATAASAEFVAGKASSGKAVRQNPGACCQPLHITFVMFPRILPHQTHCSTLC